MKRWLLVGLILAVVVLIGFWALKDTPKTTVEDSSTNHQSTLNRSPDRGGDQLPDQPRAVLQDFLTRLASVGANPVDPSLKSCTVTMHSTADSTNRQYFRFFLDGKYKVLTYHSYGVTNVTVWSRYGRDEQGSPENIDDAISMGDTNKLARLAEIKPTIDDKEAKQKIENIYRVLVGLPQFKLSHFSRIKKFNHVLPFYKATFSVTNAHLWGNENYPRFDIVIDGNGRLETFSHGAYAFFIQAARKETK